MKYFKSLNTLFLAGALIVPAALMAFPQESERSTTTTTTTETQRYYDSGTKEYHNWDANEDRAYRMYLQEQHRDYREFPKATTQEQTQYWKWRHGHPNSVIFKSQTTEEHEK